MFREKIIFLLNCPWCVANSILEFLFHLELRFSNVNTHLKYQLLCIVHCAFYKVIIIKITTNTTKMNNNIKVRAHQYWEDCGTVITDIYYFYRKW